MAEQERRTKAERRAEARAERKRAQEEAARQQKQQNLRNIVIGVAVVAVIALVAVPSISNLFGADEPGVKISQAAALESFESAGCEMVVDGQPLEQADHRDPQTAPPADVMYASSQVRPTASGSHFGTYQQPIGGVPTEPLDERATTHNLEHGSVIVWFDPDVVDAATVDDMEAWMVARMDMGFTGRGGASIFVSPYRGMSGDKPIAIRAWGYALNCQEWDQTVADSFVIDYWGTHGIAPERSFAPYPADALSYEIDATEGATGTEEPTGTESPAGSESPTGTEQPSASESATEG